MSYGVAHNITGDTVENTAHRVFKLPPADYVHWVEDPGHGLHKEKEIENVTYSVQYKPVHYIICEEQQKLTLADTLVKRRTSELDGMQYYNFKISIPGGSTEFLRYGMSADDDYNKRVTYFSFDMQKDIHLIEGKDTLPCLLFHFERVYNMAPFGIFVLGFPKGKNEDADRTLMFFDHGFNKGIVKLFFKGSDIKNAPQLETL